MSEGFKVCERCGSEFVPRVESCLDCGGPLTEIDPRMTTPPLRRPAATPPPPAEENPLMLRRADDPTSLCNEPLPYVQGLTRKLREAGIRHDVLAPEPKDGQKKYGVYVAKADFPAANEIHRRHFVELVPEAVGFVDLDGGGCPACGTPSAPGAAECPECGLAIGFGEEDLEEILAGGDEEDEDREDDEERAV